MFARRFHEGKERNQRDGIESPGGGMQRKEQRCRTEARGRKGNRTKQLEEDDRERGDDTWCLLAEPGKTLDYLRPYDGA